MSASRVTAAFFSGSTANSSDIWLAYAADAGGDGTARKGWCAIFSRVSLCGIKAQGCARVLTKVPLVSFALRVIHAKRELQRTQH